MKKILLSIALLGAFNSVIIAQGCIAIKNLNSGLPSFNTAPKSWQFNANYRFFRSYRHFSGKTEHPDRVANQTEVINYDNSLIFGATYSINNRWSVSGSIPVLYIDRSSLYEHDRINRHHTSSNGIGDIRLMGYYTAPVVEGKINLSFGLGAKLPTGNYNAKDNFYTANGIESRPVDQSIQPGDGGFGVVTELNYLQRASEKMIVYFSTMYLFNARNTNGTRTFRETLNPILANESIMSVPDQYMMRAGAQYIIKEKFGMALGLRMEGVPVKDAIGESNGFRRPGYIFSLEPGISYMFKAHSFNLNVPTALIRNRQQSVTDKETEIATGNPRHGDAAFADYLISITYSYHLTKKFF